MENEQAGQKPFTNCHTHIFTGDHVPPWLAKTFLPAPFYRLLHVSAVIGLFRWWYHKGPYKSQFGTQGKKRARWQYRIDMFVQRNPVLGPLKAILGILLAVQVLYFIYGFCRRHGIAVPDYRGYPANWFAWLEARQLVYSSSGTGVRILLLSLLLLFFKNGRNLVWFVLKQLFSFMKMLPGKQTKALLSRYVLLGRYALYQGQARIFDQLRDQYPENTEFIVLPMDMEYMEAGRLRRKYRYLHQMRALSTLKRSRTYGRYVHPFIFVDPRRILPSRTPDPFVEGKAFFDWEEVEGKVVLKNCHIKKWLERDGFRGFKIYPALGYYPFDERLLPLWKYAADNGIPIITHCIRGTIFFRGAKLKEWDSHPVFHEGLDTTKRLLLPEKKAVHFSANFTHPLNYLCLLEPELLGKVIGDTDDSKLKKLFGWYKTAEIHDDKKIEVQKVSNGLQNLKICFGHFGGEDEWSRFLENDRDDFSKTLLSEPTHGLRFIKNRRNERRPGKLEQLWKGADWYTIICSLMLQYDHVYADISYIVHDEKIFSLLKHTLRHPKLCKRVLFGTDFYVVRNHKTERCMLADALAGLDAAEIQLIARENPYSFLKGTAVMV